MGPENSYPGDHEPPQLEPVPSAPSPSDRSEDMAVSPDPFHVEPPCPGSELADGSVRSFPPAHLQVERVSAMISGAIMSTIFVTIAMVVITFGDLPPSYKWLPLVPLGLLLMFFAFRAFEWPRIAHRHKSWSLSELGIHLTQGVIWRATTSVPRARVQHTDVGQGPLQRRFGVSTLSVHTAGSDQAQVNLGGLNYDDAIAVRDFLILKVPTPPSKDAEESAVVPDVVNDEPEESTHDE